MQFNMSSTTGTGIGSPSPARRNRVSFVCKYCRQRFGYFNQFVRHTKIHPEYYAEGSGPISAAIIKSMVRPYPESITNSVETGSGSPTDPGPAAGPSSAAASCPLLVGLLSGHFLEGAELELLPGQENSTNSGAAAAGGNVTKPPRCKYKCETCSKMFDSTKLKEHIRIHTGEKPFACPLCPDRLRARFQWLLHTKRHSGQKRIKCPYPSCRKSFISGKELRSHQGIHSSS